MNSYYTNVQVWGSKLLWRGKEDGKSVQRKLDYFPSLFVRSNTKEDYRGIHGEYLKEIKPGDIRDAKDFIKKYEAVENFPIYGNTRFEYNYISDQHPYDSHIDWNAEDIAVANIDIEVGSEDGFPEPDEANYPITAITFEMDDFVYVFGYSDWVNTENDPKVRYYKCRNEVELLKMFLGVWSRKYPDVVTGWNILGFDIPYLINRMLKVLGETETKKFTPWGYYTERQVDYGPGRQFSSYRIPGMAILDYLDLYQRYSPDGKSQESYKLDAIAQFELGQGKLSYEEEGSLHRLYIENPQKFIDYNIRDVKLIRLIDDKLKLLELVFTLSYDNKCNFEDAFSQVRMWDVLTYNKLRSENIIVPPQTIKSKDGMYEGAYVKDPILGFHGETVSFDLDSLYPHLIMMYNISPETLVEYTDLPDEVLDFIRDHNINVENLLNEEIEFGEILKKHNLTVTPNVQFFRTDKQGFLAEMMETMYDDRKKYKGMSIEAKKEYEKTDDEEQKKVLKKRIARYNNLQLAKKVGLNSAYGAMGNEWFRFFDIRLASAVTFGGQLSIRWIQKKINEWMNKLLETTDIDYVIASDTDSIYLDLKYLVDKTYREKNPTTLEIIKYLDKVCDDLIQPFINKSYKALSDYINAYAPKMRMKREAICDKAIWVAKKRYILNVWDNEKVLYKEPQIKVSGLEVKKSSTPSFCRSKLTEAIKLIMTTNEETVISFIQDVKEDFNKAPLAEISFPRGVNGLEKYSDSQKIYGDKTPIHVRGALIYNHLLKEKKLNKTYPYIKSGEKIHYIYLQTPNVYRSDIISFHNIMPKELAMEEIVDYNKQFEKSFVDPLKLILDAIKWKTKKTNTLTRFLRNRQST